MLPGRAIVALAKSLRGQLLTLWFARRHPDTPMAAKLLVLATAVYALSPIDLVPEFLPVIGLVDDLLIVPFGIALALRLLPGKVIADSRAKADRWATRGKHFGIVLLTVLGIVLIWAILWPYLGDLY